jgi:glycine/D-amino acid oxidase-like deaminating enzyme
MNNVEVAIVGAGIVGISVAYYLVENHGFKSVLIIDPRDPMTLTSAQSGENYRNWWPHPLMTVFTDHSTDLMEVIARKSENRINLTRRGYALATRRDKPDDLLEDLQRGYGAEAATLIRMHTAGDGKGYEQSTGDWTIAPIGVDVLLNKELIRRNFPSFTSDITTVLHVRRAGSLSGQQLGQFMLERIREAGGRRLCGEVFGVSPSGAGFNLSVHVEGAAQTIGAAILVNAAGPFFGKVAEMYGEKLALKNVYQQKISFEDREGVIPRVMPFAIDLDGQKVNWTDEEKALLADDPATARALRRLPGGIHCRPDGAESGKWIKLGWAFNEASDDPEGEDPIDPYFPDIVLRGASRLNPSLTRYIGRLPKGAHHYGGYYTMTEENLPLIGPSAVDGVFLAGALSGFGTMSACATGAICAAWVAAGEVPEFAHALSLERYRDPHLMKKLTSVSERSLL